jgi:hypothetical protein
VPAYDIAVGYLGFAETDSALAWLQEAVNERSAWATYFAVEPRLDALRSAPRFDALIESVNSPKIFL